MNSDGGAAHARRDSSSPHRQPSWFDIVLADRSRARIAALNQLLLAGVVMVLTLLMLATGFVGDAELYFVAIIIVFALTGAAIGVPWNRISLAWLALVPVGDIVAITLMRLASPTAGFGILWVFPVMWLASGFGLWGAIGGVTLALVGYAGSTAVQPGQASVFALVLLPLLIIAIGVTSLMSARRAAAQRALLDRQATVLTQALERARRHEQVMTEVLDTVDFGVVRIERDGSTSVMNEPHALLQLDARGGAGASAPYQADGMTPLAAEELPLARARRGEAFENQRVWFGAPAGPRRALSVTARRVRDAQGEDSGAVVVSRDVTVEMAALRARDALVSSVSHELRTPLTSIMGYLELALDTPGVPAQAMAHLEIADRNAERLLSLVGDVLAASSSSEDGVELSIAPRDIDVSGVVRSAVESLLLRAAERGVTIDTSRLVPARAYADPMRLQQVMDNLLSNAVKYNRERGRVSLVTATRDRTTVILVQDTGVGMTEEDLAGIFQRYYRGVAVRGSSVAGNGLGLAISRDIARRHGGDITVSSTLGVGSTFSVTLPSRNPADADPAESIEAAL